MTVPFFCTYDHLKTFIAEKRVPDPSIPANACGYCQKILQGAEEDVSRESEEVRKAIEGILRAEKIRKQLGKKTFRKHQSKVWAKYLQDKNQISASQAWHISETYGLDIEDIIDFFEDKSLSVDKEGFKYIKEAYGILNKQRSK